MGDIADEHACRFFDELGEGRYMGPRRSSARVARVPYVRILVRREKAYLILFEQPESIFEPSKKERLPKAACKLDEDKKEVFVVESLAIEKGLV